MTSSPLRASIFLLLHVHLAVALTVWPRLGTAHALAVLLYGLWAGLRGDAARVVLTLGYIAGAEVLWRMTEAALPWEFGKYACVLVAGTALIVERLRGRARTAWPWEPAAYVLLLAPAVIPTLLQPDWARARQDISFNLSGPLTLAVLSTYLWRRRAGRGDLSRLLVTITAPIVGIVFLAGYTTLAMPASFVNDSNWVTSGGFGPNQVSTLLGLGALAAIVFGTAIPVGVLHGVLLVTMVVFVVQAVLTFSRGWVPSTLIAGLGLGAHLLTSRGPRVRFLVYGSTCVLAVLVLLPWLQTFTEQQVTARYTNPSASGRVEIARRELQAFREHPLLGTGVGLSGAYRWELAAHTEPVRMLAEHGILGLAAFAMLVRILVRAYRDQSPGLARGVTAAFALWAAAVMLHSAIRLAAVPLALSISVMTWRLASEPDG